jgi:flagellar basal body rod protein FlgG
MPSAIDVAARIMADDLFRLNLISQNLANANTTGYKKELPAARSFSAQLEAGMKSIPVDLPALTSVVDPRQGPVNSTGNPLDLALEGDGFFELTGPEGPVYTRQGSLRLDAGGRLVGTNGLAVSGLEGDIVPGNAQPFIDKQGRVYDGERLMGQLKVVRFADSGGLTPLGGGLYRAETTGEPMQAALQVRQGFLESSNVVALSEMTRLIELMRRFEAAQRLVQGYDGMLGGAIRTLGEF